MIRLAAGLVVGYLAARLVWMLTRPALATPVLARANYRGRTVLTAAGVVLPLTALLVEAGRVVAGAFGVGDSVGTTGPRLVILLAVTGFGLLGVVDDLSGSSGDRGFRGHLSALSQGRPTTGVLKLVGGAAVALVVVGPVVGEAPGRLLADAALVALCANLGNLLDRGPGRAIKGGLAAFAVLLVTSGADPALSGVAVVAGAAVGLLFDDLREHLMLGDAGANPLGAAMGLGVVLTAHPRTRDLVLAGVTILNLLGEVVSFSRVIEAVPPLRVLDRAGQGRRRRLLGDV